MNEKYTKQTLEGRIDLLLPRLDLAIDNENWETAKRYIKEINAYEQIYFKTYGVYYMSDVMQGREVQRRWII